MARSRNLKPSFFKNEELAALPMGARLLFAGLWGLADREGRLEDRPARIRAELFPFDAVDVEPWLCALAARGFIVRYQAGALGCIQVVKFAKHQNPHHREAPSVIPAPCAQAVDDSVSAAAKSLSEQAAAESPGPSRTKARPSPADSLFSDSPIRFPLTLIPSSGPKSTAPRRKSSTGGAAEIRTPLQMACARTWEAYAQAYAQRWRVEPKRSAVGNSHVKAFVQAVGMEEAPAIAAFFVGHSRGLYVSAHHDLALLRRDAAGLATEWATGQRMTETAARAGDRTAQRGQVFGELIAESEVKRAQG